MGKMNLNFDSYKLFFNLKTQIFFYKEILINFDFEVDIKYSETYTFTDFYHPFPCLFKPIIVTHPSLIV